MVLKAKKLKKLLKMKKGNERDKHNEKRRRNNLTIGYVHAMVKPHN